jgi:hypothetical protein
MHTYIHTYIHKYIHAYICRPQAWKRAGWHFVSSKSQRVILRTCYATLTSTLWRPRYVCFCARIGKVNMRVCSRLCDTYLCALCLAFTHAKNLNSHTQNQGRPSQSIVSELILRAHDPQDMRNSAYPLSLVRGAEECAVQQPRSLTLQDMSAPAQSDLEDFGVSGPDEFAHAHPVEFAEWSAPSSAHATPTKQQYANQSQPLTSPAKPTSTSRSHKSRSRRRNLTTSSPEKPLFGPAAWWSILEYTMRTPRGAGKSQADLMHEARAYSKTPSRRSEEGTLDFNTYSMGPGTDKSKREGKTAPMPASIPPPARAEPSAPPAQFAKLAVAQQPTPVQPPPAKPVHIPEVSAPPHAQTASQASDSKSSLGAGDPPRLARQLPVKTNGNDINKPGPDTSTWKPSMLPSVAIDNLVRPPSTTNLPSKSSSSPVPPIINLHEALRNRGEDDEEDVDEEPSGLRLLAEVLEGENLVPAAASNIAGVFVCLSVLAQHAQANVNHSTSQSKHRHVPTIGRTLNAPVKPENGVIFIGPMHTTKVYMSV